MRPVIDSAILFHNNIALTSEQLVIVSATLAGLRDCVAVADRVQVQVFLFVGPQGIEMGMIGTCLLGRDVRPYQVLRAGRAQLDSTRQRPRSAGRAVALHRVNLADCGSRHPSSGVPKGRPRFVIVEPIVAGGDARRCRHVASS